MRILANVITLIILLVAPIFAQLISDFQPAIGRSTSPGGFPPYRLLIAHSTDGITWTRTNKVLADRSSVADGLVLPNGRILIYFVAGAKVINGVEHNANDIVVAVSDNGGATWTYKDVRFDNIPIGATKPVDPNVVLLDNGDISMLCTIDPDMEGSQKPQTYSALSTDGGFVFSLQSSVFSISDTEILDPENFKFSDTDWRLFTGGIPGKNIYALSTNNGSSFTSQGEFCLGASDRSGDCYIVSDILKIDTTNYRIYVFGPMLPDLNEGICIFESSDANDWTIDEDSKFKANTTLGVESEKVWAPSVVKISDDKFIMIYETQIPATYSLHPTSVTISASKNTLMVGESIYLEANANYSDNTIRDCSSFGTWQSTNTSVATISRTGILTAVGSGTADITISFDDLTSNTFQITVTSESVAVQLPLLSAPKEFALFQNYQNPFNPSTVIGYQIPKASWVTLKVYDMLGKEVATLVNEVKEPGTYEVQFDASHLTSGVYIYKLQAGASTAVKKLVLMK